MRKNNSLQIFFWVLIIIAVLVWVGVYSKPSADTSGKTQVYFLNVGQGDAEYIKLTNGQDILIDGGPDSKVLSELGKVMSFSDRKIDLIVLTHPHADHLTGLLEVIRRYEVGEIWESGVDYPSGVYDAWRDEIKNKNIKDTDVVAGETREFSPEKFSVLYPLSSEKNKTIDNVNNSSVVTELTNNKINFLFLGDAEKSAQKEILPQIKLTTVIKVGHHGSSNGTLDALLKLARPAIAVIEVGAKNTYGHPTAETLNLLKQYAAQIYRTDQNGTVRISTDGQSYQVKAN